MKRTPSDDRGGQRPSWYRPLTIALVSVALVSTSVIIVLVVGFAMAMRSFGNK